MTHGCYRIGQASKALGVSSYHLRRLCEAGAIDAELTQGKQWRVPISEVTRLEREGVPPIPQRLPEEAADEAIESDHPIVRTSEERRSRVPEGLYAEPSDGVINAAEEVTITENRLRKRRLERELEEEEDYFREREARVLRVSRAWRKALRAPVRAGEGVWRSRQALLRKNPRSVLDAPRFGGFEKKRRDQNRSRLELLHNLPNAPSLHEGKPVEP